MELNVLNWQNIGQSRINEVKSQIQWTVFNIQGKHTIILEDPQFIFDKCIWILHVIMGSYFQSQPIRKSSIPHQQDELLLNSLIWEVWRILIYPPSSFVAPNPRFWKLWASFYLNTVRWRWHGSGYCLRCWRWALQAWQTCDGLVHDSAGNWERRSPESSYS